jgi:hypothetical protein
MLGIEDLLAPDLRCDTSLPWKPSGGPLADTTSIRLDIAIEVFDVVPGGSSHLNDGQLTTVNEALYCRPGDAEVAGSGANRQKALRPSLICEDLLGRLELVNWGNHVSTGSDPLAL